MSVHKMTRNEATNSTQHRPRSLAQTVVTILLVLMAGTSAARLSQEEAEQYYRQGQDALAEGRYDDAVEQFRALSRESGAKVDRAVYWQAYAEAKAGRKQAALSTLERLAKDHPGSSWLDDAQALQLELGGVAAEDAARTDDDDLKLYALDALMQADPDRAVPLLEDFLNGSHSTRLKQHALFVLAQTDSPRAAQILAGLARGGGGGKLQREAIQALGVSDEPAAVAELKKIYDSSSDRDTKRQILQALIASDAAEVAAEVAIAEKDPELRRQAIHVLGAMDATSQLERVAKVVGPEYRAEIYRAYGIAGDSERLLGIIRTSRDAEELQVAIQALGIAGFDDGARQTLLDVYRRSSEKRVKVSVLNSLMMEDDAETLIEIFRAEDDPQLKRQALQYLSQMDDPEVTRLIEEILKG